MPFIWMLPYFLLSFVEADVPNKYESGIIRYETVHFANTYVIQKDSTASALDKAKVDLIADFTRRERRDTAVLYFTPSTHFLHVKIELPSPSEQAGQYADILFREHPQGCEYALKNPGRAPKFNTDCPVDSSLSFIATDSLRDIAGICCRAWKSEELPNHFFWIATTLKRQLGPKPRRYHNLPGLILGVDNKRSRTFAFEIDFCDLDEAKLQSLPLLQLKKMDLRQ